MLQVRGEIKRKEGVREKGEFGRERTNGTM